MRNLSNTLSVEILRSRSFIALCIVIAVFLFITSTVSTSSAKTNIQHATYLSLATLNEDMKTTNYFAPLNITVNENRTSLVSNNFVKVQDGGLGGNDTVWNLDVYNGMTTAEYLLIKAKLLNSTQLVPDDQINQPSPTNAIYEMSGIIPANSHKSFPFSWRIVDASASSDGYLTINRMLINNKSIENISETSQFGENYRLVFELWRYDNNVGDFQYSWSSSIDGPEIKRSVWNQIWFNVVN